MWLERVRRPRSRLLVLLKEKYSPPVRWATVSGTFLWKPLMATSTAIFASLRGGARMLRQLNALLSSLSLTVGSGLGSLPMQPVGGPGGPPNVWAASCFASDLEVEKARL